MRKVWRWFILLVIVAGLLAACSQPESEGEKLLEQQCTGCHEKSTVVAVGRTHDEWSQKVDQMINLGAELTEEEREILVEYLAETYEP